MIDINQLILMRFADEQLAAPVRELGRYLSPLCVSLEHDERTGWSPPRVSTVESCALPLASGASQYALSVFEGLKAHRCIRDRLHLFRPDLHAWRFEVSARRLGLPAVGRERFIQACAQAAALHRSILPRRRGDSLYLRPLLSATEPLLGMRGARRHALRVLVSPCSRPSTRPLRVWIERDAIRAAPGGLGAAKTGANYAVGLAALEAARRRGFDQILFLDAIWRHRLTEAATSNVFVVRDDVILTPPLDDTLLAGVTRDTCIELLRARGQTVEEYSPTVSELIAWADAGRLQEVFFTSTASAVVAVSELEGEGIRIVPRGGGLAEALRADLDAVLEGRAVCPDGWLVPVDSVAAPVEPRHLPRTNAEALALAQAWAAACTQRDLEPVLGCCDEEVVFTSPRAVQLYGSPRVEGKPQVRQYWNRALSRLSSISIEIENVLFDRDARRLVIAYRGRFGSRRVRAAEHLMFGDHGKIIASASYPGAAL